MQVEIAADSFSVIARAQWGFSFTLEHSQTCPREAGRSRVKRDEVRLSFSHEESHLEGLRDSSPTVIIVPCWQHGQRERSTPVIFSNKSLAGSLGH